MILNCPSIIVPLKLPVKTTVCFSSGINTDQLRLQLDSLHKEAENARAKANSSRLRLMRLSEVAENLRQQAAVSVRNGKENYARELLFQKKKVMEAMERSKDRITLLDELATKLNEVISGKENELIGNVALDLDMGGDSDSSSVIFVSPKEEVQQSSNGNGDFPEASENVTHDEELKFGGQSLKELQSDNKLSDYEESLDGNVKNEVDVAYKLQEISSYEDLLELVDYQLNKIEVELVTILKFSKLMLPNKENLENSKVQHTLRILEDVQHVRERIAGIKQAEVGIR